MTDGNFVKPPAGAVEVQWAGETWFADPSGALWWPVQRALLLADLHFGKVGHFRKAGVPLPQSAFDKSLRKLDALIDAYRPDSLIVLGDLFHSDYNLEIEYFRAWRKRHRHLSLQLVRGNHDILPRQILTGLSVEDLGICHRSGQMELVHQPDQVVMDNPDKATFFRLSGHIHPGVRLRGGGRQSLFLPCFWFGQSQALLPAFGAFTGLYGIRPGPGDRVLVLTGEDIFDLTPKG